MNTEQFIPKSLNYLVDNVSFKWQTPSNIALVKYWGKSNPQIPKNASISFTLNNCHTETSIDFSRSSNANTIDFELLFEGEKMDAFKPKITQFFERIKEYCPFIYEYDMVISSSNSFPHSSGIASSASGLSAIAMCLMSLENVLNEFELTTEQMHRKASFLARLGSGSASRSIEGPLVVWGYHPKIKGSSDLFGVKYTEKCHPIFDNFQDTILLVDKGEKQVSSSVGHNLMHNHPFANQRFTQANESLIKLSIALRDGDISSFISIVESEALTLHAMMLTSDPCFILMKPNTLEIINRIWEYRQRAKSNVCFTLDAGANVHVLYPEKEKVAVHLFIKNELSKFCQNQQYIMDFVGNGAKLL